MTDKPSTPEEKPARTGRNVKWWVAGLLWGAFMYVFMTLLYPLISGEGITSRKLLLTIPVWTIGGLAYGWFLKKIKENKARK